ncbi:ras-related protein Rab-13-like [Clavelina lepadiformis]|uniref:Ras-related protein Rab-10 n=1 Tax=Clavelina lepadiformis TaxID=159417 RepID=A0ABP0GVA0_CLALP
MDLIVSKKQEFQCKLITIGDTNVGKTCVTTRFVENKYTFDNIATIGVDFQIRFMNVKGKHVKVQIWDTAGQERFRSITTEYYRGAKGVIFIYDITDSKSFKNIKSWSKIFNQWGDKNAVKMLVGNKCDLLHERQVSKAEGKTLAKDLGMMFHETSAKDDVNVTEVFVELLGNIIDQETPFTPPQESASSTVTTLVEKSKTKSCCSSG